MQKGIVEKLEETCRIPASKCTSDPQNFGGVLGYYNSTYPSFL